MRLRFCGVLGDGGSDIGSKGGLLFLTRARIRFKAKFAPEELGKNP